MRVLITKYPPQVLHLESLIWRKGMETAQVQSGEVKELALDGKWKTLLLLSLAVLMVMGLWFSASVALPVLTSAWQLDNSGQAWLTMSVQIGFVVGSLISALLNLSDRFPSHRLFTISALLAALSTALIAGFVDSFAPAVVLRFFTGLFMVGVYPVGMKIIATWTRLDRGLGIGLLTGAIAVGSASPHLFFAIGGMHDWRLLLLLASAIAALGGIIVALLVREGPYHIPPARFNWKYAAEIFRQRELRLVNFGYLSHMWELFAMWAWVASFLLASFQISGIDPAWASLTAFAVIGIGGLSCLLAGMLADRFGRTTITIVSLAISGACALLVGFLFGGSPILLTAICLLWGFAVVADSAQFSAGVSELCQREYTGTALTIQTSLGFLLTVVTVRLIPTLVGWVGWRWAFAFLAIGPALGIWAMYSLRSSPRAVKMAGGKK
jgi:MFS family permease